MSYELDNTQAGIPVEPTTPRTVETVVDESKNDV